MLSFYKMFISPMGALLTFFFFPKAEYFIPCKYRFLSRLFKAKTSWIQRVKHWVAIWQCKHQLTAVFNSEKINSISGFMFKGITFFSYLLVTQPQPPLPFSHSQSFPIRQGQRWQRPFLYIKRQCIKWKHFLTTLMTLNHKSIANVLFRNG